MSEEALAAPDVSEAEMQPTTSEDDWIEAFLNSNAAQDRPHLFRVALDALDVLLEHSPDACDVARAILRDRLEAPLNRQLWRDINMTLASYLGSDPAFLISWVAYDQSAARLQALEPLASPRTLVFLRTLIGAHGTELERTINAVLSPVEDWIRIDKHVYFDQLTNTHLFHVTLDKIDGSRISLETTPDSMANLTRHLLQMLRAPGTLTVYSQDKVEALATEVFGFLAMTSPQPGPEGGPDQEEEREPLVSPTTIELPGGAVLAP